MGWTLNDDGISILRDLDPRQYFTLRRLNGSGLEATTFDVWGHDNDIMTLLLKNL